MAAPDRNNRGFTQTAFMPEVDVWREPPDSARCDGCGRRIDEALKRPRRRAGTCAGWAKAGQDRGRAGGWKFQSAVLKRRIVNWISPSGSSRQLSTPDMYAAAGQRSRNVLAALRASVRGKVMVSRTKPSSSRPSVRERIRWASSRGDFGADIFDTRHWRFALFGGRALAWQRPDSCTCREFQRII